MSYIIACPKGILALKTFKTRAEAEEVLELLALVKDCAWRKDEMFVRQVTKKELRLIKHPEKNCYGFVVLPKGGNAVQ
jgi:hypothetical protein